MSIQVDGDTDLDVVTIQTDAFGNAASTVRHILQTAKTTTSVTFASPVSIGNTVSTTVNTRPYLTE
jgi:hypothetical protein